MMKTITTTLLFSLFLLLNTASAQIKNQRYIDKKGNTHLCGPLDLSTLKTDTSYATWYAKSYESYTPQIENSSWKKNLEQMQVDIYLGTWCGDSKNWVPKFVKLWTELGLDQNQLNFIGLYNGDEKYKQGPNGEEKGKNIHRVPTFIFSENDTEVARIVEFPQNDLEVDLAQIALGVPSKPNYKGANYLMEVMDEMSMDSIRAHFSEIVNKAYRLQKGSSELNTLGYVYLRAGEIEKANTIFYMNILCHRYVPNMYDSYGEGLEANGETERAIAMYEKAISLNPKSEHALERLAELKPEEETELKEE